ncbi:hypothetical protein [Brevibacterium sp.]|uniref:hypothetical protein n=1 Tax=Brevibacterium sp. TaxID=1701 RepID=UPI002811426C|nr:hypothetical protein [Brevibacterium sp.]
MYRRPIVTLIGNGDQITLDGVGNEFTLKPGMTGTGLAPWESTYSQLPRGGSVLRHRRRTNRTIMIPIDVHHGNSPDAYARLEDSRRRLEHLCEDVVEIRLKTKDGTRSAYGRLKDGLEGDFAKAVVNNMRMVLVLTFECEDPWFYGPWREQSRAIAKGTKPFLSALAPTRGRRNWNNAPISSWLRSGLSFAAVEDGFTRLTTNATATTYASSPAPYETNIPATPGNREVIFEVRVPADEDAVMIRPRFMGYGELAGLDIGVENFVVNPGEIRLLKAAGTIPDKPGGIRLLIYVKDTAGAYTPGNVIDVRTIYFGEPGMPFDGSTEGHVWEGRAGRSTSVEMVGGKKFFPVRLSESSVQGEYEVHIEGDEQVWPVWEIVPPGTDAKLENIDTGEALFLSGQIPDTVTVDTRPRVQDITSPSMPDGQWWDRAGRIVGGRLVEQDLFPLRRGKNRIRMTMVAATADSLINLRYQETYKAGH